ncbi:polysaccharide pyruvyl transferase family protein [Tenacibaculum sp.]|uniref:polysaccharide pyruvyl transferase family protein n=1 Tax=Tenacibaculum sp. TaxID=1906242 RepID=UPI003AA92629
MTFSEKKKIFRVTPGNFGDDLNKLIVEKYLGHDFAGNVFLNLDNEYNVVSSDTLIVAIGTILNQHVPILGKKVVLGAGTGYGTAPIIDDLWDVKFVRGPLTARRLNLEDNRFITDPAILLAKEKFKYCEHASEIGYIPHHAVANKEWERLCNDMGLLYIDPRNEFKDVMEKIMSCKLILAEAMHGAIVADTMRIPWIPVSSADKINEFKWQDWCHSMQLSYEPISLLSLWPCSSHSYIKIASNSVKKKLLVRQLKKIVCKTKPILSNEQWFNSKLNQVSDCYDEYFNVN